MTDRPREVLVIDLYGCSLEQVRGNYPALYQWLLDRVKPERDANRDKDLREKWWLNRRITKTCAGALKGLPRYIEEKITEYFKAGVKVVWNIVPDEKIVQVYTLRRNVKICIEDDICSAAPVLPDFEIAVSTIFAQ